MYKIQWKYHTEEEATLETENYLNQNFPGFLDSTQGNCTLPHLVVYLNLVTRFFLMG